jgi:hypothetical protein
LATCRVATAENNLWLCFKQDFIEDVVGEIQGVTINANLASVGLLVSTIATLAPTRRAEVSALGMKSWVAGNMASAMTGAVIGLVTLA